MLNNINTKKFPEKTASELLELLANDVIEVQKGSNLIVSMITNLQEEVPGVCFVNQLKTENIELIANKKSSFIIAPNIIAKTHVKKDVSCWVVFVSNPRLSFIKILTQLLNKKYIPGIDPSSKIHPKAKIGAGTYIGPFCTIGEVEIGEHCFIDASVTIKDRVKIGNYVTIKPSVTIGGEGFGSEFDPVSEKFLTFIHLGGVIIGDDVHIGSSTNIDKGTLGDTIIEDNCRLDNLVHIAHNVVIKKNTRIAAHTMIAGSVKVGANCWISPGVKILNGIKINDGVTLGMGAVVMKDVPASSTYTGAPARSIRKHKKMLDFIESNI